MAKRGINRGLELLYLSDPSYRKIIPAARNVAKRWAAAIDFICCGGKGQIQKNDSATRELTVLSLPLLQDSFALVNTIKVGRVASSNGPVQRMQADERNADKAVVYSEFVSEHGACNPSLL